MNAETRKQLYKELIYIADNFDQDDPEDAEMWKEYKRIKKRLGIPNYRSSTPTTKTEVS